MTELSSSDELTKLRQIMTCLVFIVRHLLIFGHLFE